jgi:hypothetical protein
MARQNLPSILIGWFDRPGVLLKKQLHVLLFRRLSVLSRWAQEPAARSLQIQQE